MDALTAEEIQEMLEKIPKEFGFNTHLTFDKIEYAFSYTYSLRLFLRKELSSNQIETITKIIPDSYVFAETDLPEYFINFPTRYIGLLISYEEIDYIYNIFEKLFLFLRESTI